MTNKEIKLELSKLTISTGLRIETAKRFYDWIVEEPEQSEQKPAEQNEQNEKEVAVLEAYILSKAGEKVKILIIKEG